LKWGWIRAARHDTQDVRVRASTRSSAPEAGRQAGREVDRRTASPEPSPFRRAMERSLSLRRCAPVRRRSQDPCGGDWAVPEMSRNESKERAAAPILQNLSADIEYGFAEAKHHLRPDRQSRSGSNKGREIECLNGSAGMGGELGHGVVWAEGREPGGRTATEAPNREELRASSGRIQGQALSGEQALEFYSGRGERGASIGGERGVVLGVGGSVRRGGGAAIGGGGGGVGAWGAKAPWAGSEYGSLPKGAAIRRRGRLAGLAAWGSRADPAVAAGGPGYRASL